MYNPKYDVPLAAGLSLAVSLIGAYVTNGNLLSLERLADSALASALEVPKSIDTAVTHSGTWFDGPGMVYDAYGEFTVNLPQIHDEKNWQWFDQVISKTQVTDTQQACEAAARSGIIPAHRNIACSARSTASWVACPRPS